MRRRVSSLKLTTSGTLSAIDGWLELVSRACRPKTGGFYQPLESVAKRRQARNGRAAAISKIPSAPRAENPDEALKLAQQAAEVVPDNPAVQDTLGWIYYRKGMYGMAVEHLKAAASKAANPRRQLHLGMAYLKSGEHDLGRNMVALALQSDPSLAREQGW
jgi:uncharacterized protein HemY